MKKLLTLLVASGALIGTATIATACNNNNNALSQEVQDELQKEMDKIKADLDKAEKDLEKAEKDLEDVKDELNKEIARLGKMYIANILVSKNTNTLIETAAPEGLYSILDMNQDTMFNQYFIGVNSGVAKIAFFDVTNNPDEIIESWIWLDENNQDDVLTNKGYIQESVDGHNDAIEYIWSILMN